jgi:hypothetical protein
MAPQTDGNFPGVQFRLDINNLNNKANGNISLNDIRDMTIPEFIQFQGRIVNMQKNRRYDTVLYKNTIAITPAHTAAAFTKGVGEVDNWANDETDTYKKTPIHTNMPKGGKWQPGELAIVHQVEAVVGFNAGKPTTSADGIVSQPAVAFATNVDIFELQDVTNRQFNLQFFRGPKQIVAEGLIEDFPQKSGKSGSGGSSATTASMFSQNMGFATENLMVKPQVIEGQEDWSILCSPLAPSLDMSTAARDIRIILRLSTWEFLRYYA